MKYFILNIFFLLLFSACNTKHPSDKPLEEVLKGKVSSLVEFHYAAAKRFGEEQKDELISKSESKYDKKGNILEEIWLRKDGTFRRKQIWKYNDNGKKIEYIDSGPAGLDCTETYKYDTIGNEIEFIINYTSGIHHRYTRKYNEKGNLIENIWYFNKNFDSKSIHKYDKDGNEIESGNYGENGELRYKFIYKYDSKGQKIEYYNYNSDGKLKEKETYKYDYKGNLVSETSFKDDGYETSKNKERWEYSYNSKCQRIGGKYFNSNDNLVSHGTIKYDEHGFIIEINEIGDNKEEKTNYEYSDFDSEGNWLKKKEFKNSELEKIEERVVGYYTD